MTEDEQKRMEIAAQMMASLMPTVSNHKIVEDLKHIASISVQAADALIKKLNE